MLSAECTLSFLEHYFLAAHLVLLVRFFHGPFVHLAKKEQNNWN